MLFYYSQFFWKVQQMKNILGVELITLEEVGKLIDTTSKATTCEWLARAGIEGTYINRKKHFSVEQIKDYLRYGKVEIRKAIELLREIQRLKGEK